jgi:hypothetical protein
MAHIPYQAIVRRIKDVVQRDGEFHRAQPRREVAAHLADRFDEVLTQLVRHVF